MKRIVAGTSHCALCNKVAELRPYGPNGQWICFACGMKDEKYTKQQFQNRMKDGLVLDLTNQKEHPIDT